MYIVFCYIFKNKNVTLFVDVHLIVSLVLKVLIQGLRVIAFSSCLGSLLSTIDYSPYGLSCP